MYKEIDSVLSGFSSGQIPMLNQYKFWKRSNMLVVEISQAF